jgi:hypothetical protein
MGHGVPWSKAHRGPLLTTTNRSTIVNDSKQIKTKEHSFHCFTEFMRPEVKKMMMTQKRLIASHLNPMGLYPSLALWDWWWDWWKDMVSNLSGCPYNYSGKLAHRD